MYDFRSDHLVLDNQRGGVFCSQLFLVACNSLSRIGALWPLHVILSIGLVLVQAAMWLRLHGCGFPDVSRRHNLTADFPFLWLLQSSHPLFLDVPRALVQGLCCRCASRGWVPHGHLFSAAWLYVVFYTPALAKRSVLDEGWEQLTYGFKNRCLGCS